MTKQEAKSILNKWANKYSTELWKEDIEAFKVGIECIEKCEKYEEICDVDEIDEVIEMLNTVG